MRKPWILCVLLAVVLFLPFTATATPVGVVTAIEGRADITRGDDPARPADLGDEVHIGDFLRTMSKSRVEVTFIDDSVTRLAPLSRLRVTEYLFDASERRGTFDLLRGTVQSVVASATPDSYFEVNTPTAVAGVRGTQFFVYFRDGVTGGASREGTFYVYSKGRPDQVRFVAAGQAFLVPTIDDIPLIRPATDEEIHRFMDDTTPGDGEGPGEETDEAGGTVGDDLEDGTASGDLFPGDPLYGLDAGTDPLLAFENTITDPFLFEQQLYQPLVQVGITTLFGDDYDNSSIIFLSLNDVRFFAYSTGETPHIWSTGSVEGIYESNLPEPGEFVTLTSGDTIGGTFWVQEWENNQWSASIDGEGQLSGWPSAINFLGTGAGSYTDMDPITESGTFSGTAEGTAEPW